MVLRCLDLSSVRRRAVPGLLVLSLSLVVPMAQAQSSNTDVTSAIAAIGNAAGVPVKASRSALTGLATFITVDGEKGIPVQSGWGSAEDRARGFLAAHGRAFGIRDQSQYSIKSVESDQVGMDHVRVQQVHRGVPVTGGELYVHMKGAYVLAANGKTVDGLDALDVNPAIGPADATLAGTSLLADKFNLRGLETTVPRLEILNRGLLEGRRFPSRLTWFFEARRIDVREFVWVDAKTGDVALRFSQLTDAKNRQIHNAANGSTLPGALIRSEGGPPSGNADGDFAYTYSGDTYDYFFNQHGRDSYDGAGGVLRSTVDFCPTPAECPYQNAFWNGTQMVYGDGFSAADDVDAHELTHAVTERTAGLFYYMQSGAINESLSDIFGETVDLTNVGGTDTPVVRWKMGEDVPGFGAIRDMLTPTLFGDPGKMTDPQLVCQAPGGDSGGVHSNSGIPNHAYALMVDGGTYNGFTISGIGLTKAGKILYRVQSHYLTSASDFLDMHQSVKRSCVDLLGTAGITPADCTEVGKALDAVEMGNQWPCSGIPQPLVPAFCPANQAPTSFHINTLDSGLAACTGFGTWCLNGPTSPLGAFATSNDMSYWGYDRPVTGTMSVQPPSPGTLPANARLQFNHSWGFENSGSGPTPWDGGVVEYSTNGGTTWTDAGTLFSAGAIYNGTISGLDTNPFAGRSAFVRTSWGFTATQLNLASLAGQSFLVRFNIGTDSSVDDYGWFLDDINYYTCVNEAPPRFDFDPVADRRADLAVYHESSGLWYRRLSSTGAVTSQGYGGPGYKAVAGDYDGDNITDEAVFHESSGLWFIRQSTTGTTFSLGFGGSGYIPVARDYDGDGKTDIAVYHPSSGLWYIRSSITGATSSTGYGGTGYDPVPADYDGDGKADIAVFHPASGLWFIKYSSTGATFSLGYGGSGYTPVPEDYDGDGKADIAVYYEPAGLWYTRGSYSGATTTVGFGGMGYRAVPADYDGDGKADRTVYHNSSGLWYIRQSLNNQNEVMTMGFGGSGFAPLY